VAMPTHALHWIPLARMDGSRDGRKRRSVVGGWPACEDVAALLMPPHLLAAVTAETHPRSTKPDPLVRTAKNATTRPGLLNHLLW
jgi:hypothetical protein